MAEYAHPESLVSTQWVADHGSDANVRLVEVDVDTSAYDEGHIAGAVSFNWQSQLQQNVVRDIVSRSEMETLLSGSGISPDTTVILYGDNNNWFAAWAFWQLKYYGHNDVRLMNGGRCGWLRTVPQPPTFRPMPPPSTASPRRTATCGPCAITCCRPSTAAATPWWTCARPTSFPAR